MDRIERAWTELVAALQEQEARLSAEVRAYPTPIARCDDQLPKLLDQRRNATAALNGALELRACIEGARDPG